MDLYEGQLFFIKFNKYSEGIYAIKIVSIDDVYVTFKCERYDNGSLSSSITVVECERNIKKFFIKGIWTLVKPDVYLRKIYKPCNDEH